MPIYRVHLIDTGGRRVAQEVEVNEWPRPDARAVQRAQERWEKVRQGEALTAEEEAQAVVDWPLVNPLSAAIATALFATRRELTTTERERIGAATTRRYETPVRDDGAVWAGQAERLPDLAERES